MNNIIERYVWTAGHEYVSLQFLTNQQIDHNNKPDFVHLTSLGIISVEDDWLVADFHFGKRYSEGIAGDPHFKEFTEISENRFKCKGALVDLMFHIQQNAEHALELHTLERETIRQRAEAQRIAYLKQRGWWGWLKSCFGCKYVMPSESLDEHLI